MLLLSAASSSEPPPAWAQCPDMADVAGAHVKLDVSLWLEQALPADHHSLKMHGAARLSPPIDGAVVTEVWLSRGSSEWTSAVKHDTLVNPPHWSESKEKVLVRALVTGHGDHLFLRGVTSLESKS